MTAANNTFGGEFYERFKVFHELMTVKIRDILLVSSPYEAFIMEEGERLSSRILNEYRGLNLSQPPLVTRASSAYEALKLIKERNFDMVIAMPHLDEMDVFSLGVEIKKIDPWLPVILLAHSLRSAYALQLNKIDHGIDKIFIWSGNSDLLLALIKNAEDLLNVEQDTQKANVRVMILVEDSPIYYSSFLPLIYKEIVIQIQAVLEAGLNEEHRLLTMRARPKILLAENYDEALLLYEKYREYLFGVISDVRLPKEGQLVSDAGIQLLSRIRQELPDLPLLMLSSEPENRKKAANIPAVFLDKNSQNLLAEIHDFFLTHLGFGDFIFRRPDGSEIERAKNLRQLQEKLIHIPDESLVHHAKWNHFSNWIMARSEIALASKFRDVKHSDFDTADCLRHYIISNILELRRWRQKGVVTQFNADHFDPHVQDFVKIGDGSLGGKGRGLAFMSAFLQENQEIYEKYPKINILIPKTLVLATDCFESFVKQNNLRLFADDGFTDQQVSDAFLDAQMPDFLSEQLKAFLSQVHTPLSVRSSSLLEDAQFQPYAGLYQTYMIPNNQAELLVRLEHLIRAIKMVYASTYYEGPKAFSKSTSNKPQEEAMAVIIERIAGDSYGDYFYPAVSGVAQTHNFYPVSYMKPEEGIVHIALGFGKTVVEGEKTLRFSPKYPAILPQLSTVDDILANSQRFFYALKIRNYPEELCFTNNSNLEKREIDEATDEFPVISLASTYIPEDHRIRDTSYIQGPKVLTFAPILKYNLLPLSDLLCDILELGRKSMGTSVEIEFALNLSADKDKQSEFYFLQMRPMVADENPYDIQISREELQKAFCISSQALGNGKNEDIADIVYIKPEDFKADSTVEMAQEIDKLNAGLAAEKRPYLLIGPGRWGSADRFLGIPVQWRNISGVAAIIELRNEQLRAEPSQGSHFFQNITSLGIHYITVTEGSEDRLDWEWLHSLPTVKETGFLRHVRLDKPMILKIDGRESRGFLIADF